MTGFAYTIFCDDVRQEINNKQSFIGTYGQDIVVPDKEQFTLLKFFIVLNYCVTKGVPFKEIEFVVELPDQDDIRLRADDVNIVPDDNTSRLRFSAVFGVNNLVVKPGTRIMTYVLVDGVKVEGDKIHIKSSGDLPQ
ncbi:hypothetical protein [Luteithermobacter gelatinilyticus]|uniref:hypothetical protein n=1 Tax=Luteithermobacter gelatinilyticus TaxID=2582913 RepID=UPI001106BA73|nr:hypothetical protein [Luteithermobacter gelatinilyticus]